MIASVRGGSSRATSVFIRRSTNGRIRSRSRAAAAPSPLPIRSGPRSRKTGRRGAGAAAVADGLGPALLEVGAPAEQAGIREVELAPQLVEPVLDRRTR